MIASSFSKSIVQPRAVRDARRLTVVVKAEGPSPLKARSRKNENYVKLKPGSSSPSSSPSSGSSSSASAASSSTNPISSLADRIPDPILRAAVKEPIAFWGGVFAGSLRLSLDQDPLKSVLDQAAGDRPAQ